jgi:SAM-dependent methyltransferase
LHDLGPGSIGVDTSTVVVKAARDRLRKQGASCLVVVGDVRQLPLRPGSLRQILSGSSLDHFQTKEEIDRSLRQLAEVLSVDGVLVITFDNPHNPVVWVRNHLPFQWLNRLGLIPYYVGVTYNRREARAQLAAAGLTVTHETVVGHAPRAPATILVKMAEHFGWRWLEPRLSQWMDRCEVLELWSTRYRTGYYLAFRAEKREEVET